MSADELSPDQIVRYRDGHRYFGYRATQLAEKIQAGEIPAPIPLSNSGRAKGWTGRQIIDHHRRLLARAEQQATAAVAAHNETGA